MALPAGTITLNKDYILLQNIANNNITSFGKSSAGKIIQVGSNVTTWLVNDIIVYDNQYSYSFNSNGAEYLILNQNNILFKYAPPSP